jgi:hypothetical protein
MILKLVRTELQSAWLLILVTWVVSFQMWMGDIGRAMPGYTTPDTVFFGPWPFPILLAGLGVRRLIQKRRRLYAQLPVTAMAIRVSSWLSYFFIVAIAYLIGVVILAISPPAPEWGWSGLALLAGRFVAVFTCVVALVRIFVLGLSMQPPFKLIVPVAAAALFFILWAEAGMVIEGRGPLHGHSIAPWTLFSWAAAGIAAVLIMVDILLDRFADNYLS